MLVAHAQFYNSRMRGTEQSQPPPGRMGKSARRIRYELDDAGVFPAVRFLAWTVNCVSRVWKKMTRCCTRSFTATIQQEIRPATQFDASGKLIDRTSASLPSASVLP
jgi:hypothetical protein